MPTSNIKLPVLGLAALFLLVSFGARAADAGPDAGAPSPDAGEPGAPDAGPVDGPDAGAMPDPVWTCDPNYYDADDGCDCECGIPDPDCTLANPANPTVYGCPAGIGCSLQGYCEIPSCGNGTVESDVEICDDGNTDAYDGCSPGCKPESGFSCTADPTQCLPVPAGWSSNIGPFCSDGRYADGMFCDCGCGVVDADCTDATSACDGLPLGCIPSTAVNIDGEVVWEDLTLVPDLADNTRCIGNVCGDTWVVGGEECDDGNATAGDLCDDQCVIETPDGWSCNPEYVLDPECDCGCGAPDPACPGVALDPLAECAFDECRGPENVDPLDHTRCLDPVVGAPDAGSNTRDAGDPDAGGVEGDAGVGPSTPTCSSQRVPTHSFPLHVAWLWGAVFFIVRRSKRAAIWF